MGSSSSSAPRSPSSGTSTTTLDNFYDDDDEILLTTFEEGEPVEARWKGGKNWYSAVITKTHIDGTYDIRYNDGDREIYLDREFIRSREYIFNEKKTSFEEGDFVEARWKGGQRWYNAMITRIHMDGTCDIRYNDGDREIYLGPEFIRHRN